MTLRTLLNNLRSDESGQDLIEYALVASILALGAVVALGSVATAVSTTLTAVGTRLTTATPA